MDSDQMEGSRNQNGSSYEERDSGGKAAKSDFQDLIPESYKFPLVSSGAANICFQDKMPRPQIKCYYCELQTCNPFQAIYTAEVWLIIDDLKLHQDQT